ncbi:recombinase family protein [Victivallis sp. Marseille-Q1083]|uniref:recombinase family protein n=1 Tax=Victivallis sp. Marseille-Q1083 TaxID=2717288 RepID=UPI0034C6B95E
MNNQAKTYLLYARVSPKGSSWHGGETSVPLQLAECRDYVLRRDPAARFIEVTDELRSGKSLDRPGIQQIIAELDSGTCEWDCIVVWHLDRLTRSLADSIPLFQHLYDAGKGLMSVRQNIDMFSAGGRFMLNIFVAAAQYEREMISERTAMKMTSIAQKGKIPYGRIPIGYKRTAGNRIVVDPDGAAVVRDIFDSYVSGTATNDELFQRYHDRIKSKNTFYKILRNRLYIGEVEYDGKIFKGEHEAIIDHVVFDQVQNMLPGHKYKAPRPGAQKYKYLLAGLVKCSCGRQMTNISVLKKGRRYAYYKCTEPSCKNAINAEKLDTAILEKIKSIAQDTDFLLQLSKECEQEQKDKKVSLLPEMRQIEQQLASAHASEVNIANMFKSGLVTRENMVYWNAELSAVVQQQTELRERQSQIQRNIDYQENDLSKQILQTASGWAQLLDNLSDEEESYSIKRNLILAIVQNVVCTAKGSFDLNLVMSKSIEWYPGEESNLRRRV